MRFTPRGMRNLAGWVVAFWLGSMTVAAMAADVTGAGATFPYAVYTKWADAYKTATGNRVNYQGIGSSGGIKQIKAKVVDFGGTDAPLTRADLIRNGLVQFPAVVGAVTLVANVPGFKAGDLKLDGPTAAKIFSGVITRWNDPAIAAFNPGAKLPNLPITLVHRSDGSGTTFVFTRYLSKQSEDFKRRIGFGTTVSWPSNAVGGKGNPGVAASVKGIRGAIGYVDIADASKNKMNFIALRNKAGNYIVPNQQSVADALAGANFKVRGMAPDLLDQTHVNAWPITSATYILVYQQGRNPDKQQGVVEFFKWSLNNGKAMAEDLGFVPLPDDVVRMVEAELARIK